MYKIIGIMGPSKCTKEDLDNAYQIGKYSAEKGYSVLTGGKKYGIMNEALKGAKERGGLTIGILPTDDKGEFSEYVDIPIITTMRSGRNFIETMTCDVIIACGISSGTSSEISLAIKSQKDVILVGLDELSNKFYSKLSPNQVNIAKDYMEAIKILDNIIKL